MLDVPVAMIFKSIKWRLQLWYGLILVLVLAGFGFTAYQLERGRQMRRIDDELQRRVEVIAAALRPPPPRGPDIEGQPFGAPPPDQSLDEAPPRPSAHPPVIFRLPAQAAGLFGPSDPNNFYFLILRDGKEFAGSTNQPNRTVIQSLRNSLISVNIPSQFPGSKAKPPPPSVIGEYRDLCRPLPSGDIIWVGCSMAPELQELNVTALKLAGIGGIILLLGLAGGWWLAGRALRPIAEISSAATKISAGDLSQRIDVAETESELGRLAAVLNSTFARLETAFAQQRQFTADAAHELRTPVSVMLTQTQTVLSRERAAAEYREAVEVCQRSAQRLRRLIESLLELARLDAGQETLKRLRFNLAGTVGDCAEQLEPIANQHNVKILSELTPVEISGDTERLAQVITNLLANAIQYSQPGGEVRVKLEAQPGFASLAVTDTGRGISSEDRPHVFERFYRGDKSRTTSTGNAGLGLAISKAIVEAHGGTISVSSQPGTGTTFILTLPIV
ncbi:MAG TPA: ATP-binding protein [Candidatus Sulfopaludibacter sp.]|nr:ATP-binding protein [Candidatus Sulfopaludibacter sp.]